MKKTLAVAVAACLLLAGTVFALPAKLSGAVRLFSHGGKTVYGLFDPRDASTAIYTARGDDVSRLCKIEKSGISSDDYAVLGDKAYACFGDPQVGGAVRLMRIDLRNGLVAKAAEFQSAIPVVYVEPADGKLLLFGLQSRQRPAPDSIDTRIAVYDPATGSLKSAVALVSPDSDQLTITAATYDQGSIFALVERVKGGEITYTLRTYGMDGTERGQTAIPTAFGAPGGRRATGIGVAGDYVKVNNAGRCVLFRRTTGKPLYDGPLLTLDGENTYIDAAGNRYRLDMAAGTLIKTADAPKAGDAVEAYAVMVETLTQYNPDMDSPKILAFDTAKMPFAGGEKEVFLGRMRAMFPKSRIVEGNLDELEKQGFVDREGAFRSMKWGTLVTIEEVSFTDDAVKFSINNFVSGRAGHMISGAELKKENGVWTLKNPGVQGIS